MKDAFSRFISKIKVYWSIGPQPWISVVNINEWANHQCNISPTHSHMHTHTHTQAHHAQLLLKTSHLYTYPHPLPSGKTTVNIQGIKCWVIQLWVVCWPSRPSPCPPPPPKKKKKSSNSLHPTSSCTVNYYIWNASSTLNFWSKMYEDVMEFHTEENVPKSGCSCICWTDDL